MAAVWLESAGALAFHERITRCPPFPGIGARAADAPNVGQTRRAAGALGLPIDLPACVVSPGCRVTDGLPLQPMNSAPEMARATRIRRNRMFGFTLTELFHGTGFIDSDCTGPDFVDPESPLQQLFRCNLHRSNFIFSENVSFTYRVSTAARLSKCAVTMSR